MDSSFGDTPTAQSAYERGRLLQSRQRYADAAQWFRRALAADPQHASSHAMLSLCLSHEKGKEKEVVEEARKAVALDPEQSFYRGILAMALLDSAREGEKGPVALGLTEAREAVRLDTENSFGYAVLARAYLAQSKYLEAEAAARQALARDTDDTMAAEALSTALIKQHKDEDNSALVAYQLKKNPEDASSHVSAGWTALMAGQVESANTHFLEALRLNPMSDGARHGLVESYRARSAIYRTYIQFVHFMARFSEGRQKVILVGGFLIYQLAYRQLSSISPVAAGIVVFVWMLLVLWSHLARGLGSFFILFDAAARRALRPREKWEGAVVGSLVLLALLFLGKTALSHFAPDKDAAILLFLAAVPSAAAFGNRHYWGERAYTLAAVIAGACALYFATAVALRVVLPELGNVYLCGILLSVAMTWVSGLGLARS